MYGKTRFPYRPFLSNPGSAWGVLALIGILAALVLALPALLWGMVLQRLVQGRSWSTLLWVGLTIPGVLLLLFLVTHGLNHLVLAQTTELGYNAHRYQANLTRWDLGRLWSLTWPLWLRTMELVPAIALWRDLEHARGGGSEAVLRQQEDALLRVRTRAKTRAIRRVRHPGRIPDVVDGQMVIGVAIADEDPSSL